MTNVENDNDVHRPLLALHYQSKIKKTAIVKILI